MISCHSDCEGVSPVIGVILMVAITVILAAVVGTFVLDLTNNLDRHAEASVDSKETPYNGSTNGQLKVQLIAVQNADSVIIMSPDGTNLGQIDNVGDMVTLTISGSPDYPNGVIEAGDTITAIGVLEGSRSILQTYDTTA